MREAPKFAVWNGPRWRHRRGSKTLWPLKTLHFGARNPEQTSLRDGLVETGADESDDLLCRHRIGRARQFRMGGAPRRSGRESPPGKGIGEFAQFVAARLAVEEKVALGFECPLWIPIADEPSGLTGARPGEGNRAWSASAGATSLTAGLAQVAWILDRIRQRSKDAKAFLDWRRFERSQSGLFIWEACVTGSAKTGSHDGDAMAGVNAFAAPYATATQIRRVLWNRSLELVR